MKKVSIIIAAAALFCALLPAQAMAADELIAKWKFDETSGKTAADLMGVSNGTLVKMTDAAWTAGLKGNALNFSTEPDSAMVTVPDNTVIKLDSASMTVSCLIKTDPALDQQLFIKGHSGFDTTKSPKRYGIWWGAEIKGREIRFTIDDNGGIKTGAFTDKAGVAGKVQVGYKLPAEFTADHWIHFVGVRDMTQDSVKLYINGVRVKALVDCAGKIGSDLPLVIGNSAVQTNKFKGMMDEFSIYNYAMSPENILAMYAGYNTQAVKVTFVANTATVPDTLGPNSVVQIRGSGGPLTWGGDSPVFLHNIGGDYWRGTADFQAGAAVEFKFYTNAEHDTVNAGAGWEHQGWEGDVSGGNRKLTVGTKDTTLALQFVNGYLSGVGQYEAPYTSNDSTKVVWVRVNVQGWADFNATTQQIGLRGSNNADWGQTGELSWGKTTLLKRESNHVNSGSQRYSGGYFYSGAVHVPNKYVAGGIEFKVVVHAAGAALDEDWGKMIHNPSLQNKVRVSASDTTAHWFWFDNMVPIVVSHKDQVVVTFNADMSNALTNRGFAFGDTLQVRSGYFGTASETRTKMMLRQGFSNIYTATDTVVSTVGQRLDYQYYQIKNGSEYREVFYNFGYTGETVGEAERRVETKIASKTIAINDILNSQLELHRMPVFRSTKKLTKDVLVTFTCDLRPAIRQVKAGSTLKDIQGPVNVTDASKILGMGVIINGPATGTWATWGSALMSDTARVMYDNGTHGDAVAGDSIFTRRIQFLAAGTNNVVGQEFKFGIGGGDNEGGEGGYGNNHVENINDSQGTYTIASQFGSINPPFYNAWDYDKHQATGVDDAAEIPVAFGLDQNYPNPFNPVTHIEYRLARPEKVLLTVHDLMGRRVATLVDRAQTAGSFEILWDGRDDAGRMAGSGIYFYTIETGSFKKTQKMLLMK